VTVKAANSNTVQPVDIAPPPLPEFRPATVVMVPRNAPPRDEAANTEPRARVTLQRETATFSVPVSEAVMPASLKAAMTAFDGRWTKVQSTAGEPGANADANDAPQRHNGPEEQLSDDDRAFLRRIAPPAAE
jgi:hypothetical protein